MTSSAHSFALTQRDWLHRLVDLGVALSCEPDYTRQLERMVLEAKNFANADGATLYLLNDQDELVLTLLRNGRLGIILGGTSGKEIHFPPIRLHDPETGEANHRNVASLAALTGNVINVTDVYDPSPYDFSGIRKSDADTGYRSRSLLTVPLCNHQREVVGALQLVNARGPDGAAIRFSPQIVPMIETMASLADKKIEPDHQDQLRRLIDLGIALSAEHNHEYLLERILLEAKNLTNADGGTLYLSNDKNELVFEIVHNDSLGIAIGGTTGKPVPFPPLKLYDPITGMPNHYNISTYAALTGEVVEIPDAYNTDAYDFSGTKKFDAGTGYHSQSFLTVPLRNYHREVIGVLQLINARDSNGRAIRFPPGVVPLVEALASQAAVALDNQRLLESQRKLLESFIQVIAHAIDAKSPYTGGHCTRVPVLAKMLATEAEQVRSGPLAGFGLSVDQRYELHLASWLHDCGKVTTPEYVVDKSTKLETIHDRIHEVRMRFEVLRRDAEIEYLKGRLEGGAEPEMKAAFDRRCHELEQDFAFVAECNLGGEFMSADRVERIKTIASQTWVRHFDNTLGVSWLETARLGQNVPNPPAIEPLLADRAEHAGSGFNKGEIYNLSIDRGTLTKEERNIINSHVTVTLDMLNRLPFPAHMRNVPEYAGGHHERMDGKGYPQGLPRDQMSIPARIMAIADIFEALTASDRPYKKAKTLSEAVKIMWFMKKENHIDPDLFDLFLRSGVYRKYGDEYLKPEQVDKVDISPYLTAIPTPE
ncbi:MAG: GAF domain-containing protein [Alphaproteobacteria bacterium]|nr:GAF domain-containing protein [Alphaproteobacteria bacterium]